MKKSTYLVGASALVMTLSVGFGAGSARAADSNGPTTVDEIVVTAQKREQSLQDVPIVVTAVSAQLLRDANVKDIKDLTILTPGLTVTSTSSEVATTARIRGVGTVGDNLGLESSVGVVIDGVYRPRNGVGFGDLGELERIEVLKGPQGTLFGKNTSAGVINIITKRPSFDFSVDGEATVSNFNGYGASLSLNGPLVSDKVAGRLFFAGRKRDGFYSVRVGSGPRTRTDDQNQDFYTLRGQLRFVPSANFDVNVIADYTKRQENCCAAVQILEAGATQNYLHTLDPTGGGVAIPVDPFSRVAYSNRNTTQDIEDKGISAEAHWQLPGETSLTSVTAYRTWRRTGETDPDYSTVDVLAYNAPSQYAEFKQFSQELRLAGRTEHFDWLIGAFYAQEQLNQSVALRYGTQFEQFAGLLFSAGASQSTLAAIQGRPLGTTFVTGQGQQDHYQQDEHSLAFFTNDTLHLTDKFDVTVGLRWTSEHKSLDTLYNNTDGGLGCANLANTMHQSATAIATASLQCGTFQNYLYNNLSDHQTLKEEEFTGTFKVSYRWSRELFTYASYARGYKAGGFNLDRLACPYQANTAASIACTNSIVASGHALAPNPEAGVGNQGSLQPLYDTSFKPEFVDSYEIGAKSTLLDRTLLFNVSLFFQKYTGFQLNAFNGLVFTVTSVPEVVSKGVDVDFVWLPNRHWTLQGGVTYADTRYADKDASVLGAPCTSIVYGNPATGGVPAGCSLLPGKRLSLAPLWSSTLAVTYEHPISANLVGRANISAKYVTEYNTGSDLNPVKVQKGYALVNGRVGIGPEDDHWAFEIWGQNLLNQDYYQVAFDATAQSKTYNAFLGQPRTYGATLRVKF